MREAEMRRRIDGFLKRRMRGMLAPALGLGLAVVGCGKTTSTPIYSAPNPDGPLGPVADATGLSYETLYSAPIAPDASVADAFVAKDTMAVGPETAPDTVSVADAATDFGKADLIKIDEAETSDAKQDASSEAGSSEAGSSEAGPGLDLGIPPVRYMAQAPDAGRDLGMMALYMAPSPTG
jgi:hypothetical protein